MAKQGDEVRKLAEKYDNFKVLVQRWEQNNEPLPEAVPVNQEDPLSSSTAAAEPSSAIETETS